MTDFQNCHIWPWNVAIGQNSRSGTYTLFLTQGLEIELILTLRAAVFRDTRRFSKFSHLGMNSRSSTNTLFLSQGVEIELIFALRAVVSETQANFLTCHIWAWNLASGQSSRSCTRTLILPQGVEIELIFALRAAVSEIRVNFQICHICAWNLASGQSSRSCTYTLFLPQEFELELIFVLRAAVSEIQANFQNCHIWAWNLAVGQSSMQKWHVYNVNYSRVPNFTPLCSTIARFPDNWGFWFLHRVQWCIWNFQKKKLLKFQFFKLSKIPIVVSNVVWNFYSHMVPSRTTCLLQAKFFRHILMVTRLAASIKKMAKSCRRARYSG